MKGHHPTTNTHLGAPERVYPPLAEQQAKWEAAAEMRALQRTLMKQKEQNSESILAQDEVSERHVQGEVLECQECDEELEEEYFARHEEDHEWGLEEIEDFFGLQEQE